MEKSIQEKEQIAREWGDKEAHYQRLLKQASEYTEEIERANEEKLKTFQLKHKEQINSYEDRIKQLQLDHKEALREKDEKLKVQEL